MAEKELIAARAKVQTSKSQLMVTVEEIKHRLKPATLASDAWHGVKDKSSEYSGKGVKAVMDRPGAAGGAAVAVVLFLLRGPLAHLLTRLFGGADQDPGRVTTELSKSDKDYDLTAPVVSQPQGVKA